MIKLFNALFFALSVSFSVSSFSWAADPLISQKQRDTAEQLIQDALKSDLAYTIVESLTTEVGPRLAGSSAEVVAREWGKNLGTELEFDKVSIEAFLMPFWDRGELSIQLTSPYPLELHGTALGGAAPSSQEINADIVYYRSLEELAAVPAGKLSNKIAFIDGDIMVKSQIGAGYGSANQRRRVGWQHAQRAGAQALIIRSVGSDSHRFAHAGMMRSDESGEWASIPVIAISNPDADQLRRLHQLEKPLAVSVNSNSKWKGKVDSGNVILDLIGSEKPEEIVLIGAHLDSWDLGTGAVDDGAGIAIVTAAAKLIANLDTRPKRTIRVVMFGAEEVGLLGARAYAAMHADQLENHVLATESDFGAEKVWELSSNVNAQADVMIDEIASILSPLGILRGSNTNRSGGPDIIPLVERNVPTIRLQQNGMDYFDLHHTPDDTLDKINPQALAQNVAAYAATIYLIADSDVIFNTIE